MPYEALKGLIGALYDEACYDEACYKAIEGPIRLQVQAYKA